MMKKLLVAALVITNLVACKGKNAFNYSENFVKKERDLGPAMISTDSAVEKFILARQFDSAAAVSERMEKQIDEQLQTVISTPAPDVPEGPEFKKACVKYFTYMKSIFTSYKNFGNAKTDDERVAEAEKMQKVDDQRTGEISDIKNAQLKFAKANGFRVEN